ncbi:ssl1498 family light-harvesting-like protein [Nostoc sp. LEGE 06077]|uniref:photosystem II assembly protein Psb34 n=1 Tax=Nostoc sp. LEGE 06077 TaxID=915325 RepID=UPI0018802777|nr:ssl1498 family light-harvesting-like protein [Nostoc sp. LEGE 06077]MBE9206513.1 ssl1498 family light-harvesting-like protein [Nostoc sp. LEGE 06077]
MYTTINGTGILNNYPTEPQLDYAEYPNQEKQNRYKLQGAVVTLLVTALVLVALGVS